MAVPAVPHVPMEFEVDSDTRADDVFIVRFSAWEGPIEALLDLARSQRLDLARIDMVDLVDQFQSVVAQAMSLRLELAADWLVMAAWLAYLKSRMLLQRPKAGQEKEQDEDVLAYHLKRLDAVKTAAFALAARPYLGKDWFAPGGERKTIRETRLGVGFAQLLAAYPKPRFSPPTSSPDLKPFDLVSVDAAIARLCRDMPAGRWTPLLELVPRSEGLRLRSNIATSLVGSLELAKRGEAEISQDSHDSPVMVRRVGHDAA